MVRREASSIGIMVRRGRFDGPKLHWRLNDPDRNVTMSDRAQNVQQRYSPYARPARRGDGCFDRGGGRKARSGWYKVTIPHDKKYDERGLLTALQSVCSLPFIPVQYHVEHNMVQFYVDDSSTASALRQCCHKITDPDGYKVEVHVNPSAPPLFLQSGLKPEDLMHLKRCMAKRFDGTQQALHLNNMRTDPYLVSNNIEVMLKRKTSMGAVTRIIEENLPELTSLNLSNNGIRKLDELAELVSKVPHLKTLNLSYNELKSERELDKIKDLKLVELWLNRNPLCDVFKDQSSYVSAVRQRFPQLLKLDGNDLPPPSPAPTLTVPQQEMLVNFSQRSGMSLEWSLKCLQDNDWDFNRAAHSFTHLKTEGKIPKAALRNSPYARPARRGDGRFDRGGGRKARSGWYKVTIPHDKKYDERRLLTALQSVCSLPFIPVQYHVEHNMVQFYVDDSSTASALRQCCHKITDPDGYKVEVHVNPSAPPLFLQSGLKPEDLMHLKRCMAKRFDGTQQALHLNNMRTDPYLVSNNIEVMLKRKTSMGAVTRIIEENLPELTSLNLSNNGIRKLDELAELVSKVPHLKTLNLSYNELKSERELDKIKDLKLVELWLNRNPLCDVFKDQSSYVSAVRQRFPQLLKLDGNDLPPPSSAPTLTVPQQEMLVIFSQRSSMNLEWSLKCLQDNDWDFNRAAHSFTHLKTEGKIPKAAFRK